MTKFIKYIDLLLLSGLFIINIIIQNYNLGKLLNVFTDEGVYLYSAKLLTEGYIPYKDFFLGQPFYILLVPAALLITSNFDINIFHFLYTIWFFSIIFPLYFITVRLTNSRLATILSLLLFLTYQELVQWGAHQLDLRQTSLPFLALSLFFVYVKPKPKISAILLSIFAVSLVTNLVLSIFLITLLLIGPLFDRKKLGDIIRQNSTFLITFGAITFICYITMFLIPSSLSNIIYYQLDRPFLSREIRFYWLIDNITGDWPIFLFGLLGSLIYNKKVKLFGLFNIFGLIAITFIGSNYYPHYLTILAVGLTLSAAIFISYLNNLGLKYTVILLIILGIYQSSYNNLKYQLTEKQTPEFFTAANILKKLPSPLFTFEPIYGLYSGVDLTYHYNLADMRYFRVMGKNLSERNYFDILNRSGSIIIEPFGTSLLPPNVLNYIKNNFQLVYRDHDQQIYSK